MTWRIIKQGWDNADSLFDTRIDMTYAYEELNGAKYVTSNDLGEVCFVLADERIAWLVSTDVETVEPLHDPYLREPHYTEQEHSIGFLVYSVAAPPCVPDIDNPSLIATTIEEIEAWLMTDEADEHALPNGSFQVFQLVSSELMIHINTYQIERSN